MKIDKREWMVHLKEGNFLVGEPNDNPQPTGTSRGEATLYTAADADRLVKEFGHAGALPATVSEFLSWCGRRGGSAKSEKKTKHLRKITRDRVREQRRKKMEAAA